MLFSCVYSASATSSQMWFYVQMVNVSMHLSAFVRNACAVNGSRFKR